MIDQSATNQNQLIGDLLDVSSITTGKLRLDTQSIEIVPVIEDPIETVALAATAKNIQIETQLDPASCQVLGDCHGDRVCADCPPTPPSQPVQV